MELDRKRRVFRVLREAMDAPESERAARVVDLCAGDDALANEVFGMLADNDVPLMDGSAAALAGRLAEPDDRDLVGQILGGWRVLALLGSGGMGTVYHVRRVGDGYAQDGALKLVKRGMDTQSVLARFRRERHILSRFQHAHIAGLLDGGVSPDGRPYLVMAHVEGEPLLDWAVRVDADLDRRLRLFLQLCDAVAHAHQQLIVHRDIKPGNILVDANGDAKLLDFGIAKMLEDTDDGDRTLTSVRVLSRAYAAPEQYQGGEITTATDIFQLGVVLYELLSGERHTDAGDSSGSGRADQRLARARDRAGEHGPERIPARRLRGDLGVIVARATDPEPARRYGTVAAFADDLARFLQGRPIQARPNSAWYRLRRFVARHRVSTAVAGLALAALIATAILALMQARRADQEARLARAAQDFLVRVFDASAPDSATGARISARHLLDQGVVLIGSELGDQPRLRNEMLLTMGRLYRQLGQYDAAAELLHQAQAATAGESIRNQVMTALELATVERHRERVGEAERALGSAFALSVRSDDLQSSLLLERARLREMQGRYEDALEDARAAVGIDQAHGPAGQSSLIQSRHAEALALTRLGRIAEALPVFEDAVTQARHLLGEHDTRLGQLYNDYAGALLHASRPGEAETAARAALAIGRQRLDAEHPAIGQSLQVLGGALRQQGRLDDAHEALESALAIQRQALGDHHGDIANSLNSLAILALTRQQNALAERYLREALAIQDALGQGQATPSITMASNLGTALMRQGNYDEAEPLLLDALERHRSMLGERHPAVFNSLHSLGQLALRQGRPDAAVAYAQSAVDLAQQVWGTSRELAIAQTNLAAARIENGQADQALDLATVADRTFAELGASADPRRWQAVLVQARACAALGQPEPAQERAGAVVQHAPSPSVERARAYALLARLAKARGDGAEAGRHRRLAEQELALLPAVEPAVRHEVGRD